MIMSDNLKYVATGIFLVAALMWLAKQHMVFLIALRLGMMYSVTYAVCYVLIRWVKRTFYFDNDPQNMPGWLEEAAAIR